MAVETSTANNSASPETGGTGSGGAAPIERMFADVAGSGGEATREKPQERRSEREPQQPQRRERVEPEPDGEEGDEPEDDDLDDLGVADDKSKSKPKEGEEGDEDDEEGDGEGDEPEGDEDPEIDLDGKGTKVRLSEVKTGYLRQADYTRKTTELAQDRDTVYAYAKEMKADRDALIAQAESLNALAKALQPSPEVWAELKKNPAQYLAAKEEWDKVEETRAKIIQAARDALGQGQANAKRERDIFVNAENAKLREIMPAIFDPKKGPAIQERIFKYGERMGYTREELQGAVDHREIMTLWKAMRYDEIKGTAPKPKGEKRGEREPAPVQGNRAPQRQVQPARGVVRQQADRKERIKAADAALRRSGSTEDAALAFTARFG